LLESDRRDPLAMQASGEIAEQRIARIGRDPADDELMARDTDHQRLSALEQ
jgi:hypothetical protein